MHLCFTSLSNFINDLVVQGWNSEPPLGWSLFGGVAPFYMGSLNSMAVERSSFHHPTNFINELSRLGV